MSKLHTPSKARSPTGQNSQNGQDGKDSKDGKDRKDGKDSKDNQDSKDALDRPGWPDRRHCRVGFLGSLAGHESRRVFGEGDKRVCRIRPLSGPLCGRGKLTSCSGGSGHRISGLSPWG